MFDLYFKESFLTAIPRPLAEISNLALSAVLTFKVVSLISRSVDSV